MKNKLIIAVAVAAFAGFSVQAGPISGSIGFTGNFTGGGSDLSAATAFSISSFSVSSATGDFVGAGAPDSFASPIGVNGNGPSLIGSQLWSVTVGSTVYDLLVSSETQPFASSTQLLLTGFGTLEDGTAADNSGGSWEIGFGKAGASFTWQSTSASIPDGGTTVGLLGLALGVCGVFARKFKHA